MSRGPGRIERLVAAEFASRPDDMVTSDELAALAYPGVDLPEKRHRVAVLRAADKVALRSGWRKYVRPGRATAYFNPLAPRSYALARMRHDFLHDRLTDAELRSIMDGAHRAQGFYDKYRALILPGGAWFQHTEIWRAEREGRHDDAQRIEWELNADVQAQMQKLRSLK